MWLVQHRSLGRSGLEVSRLGLGLMTWGNQTDEHEAREELAMFVEAGGTLLDTAHTYAGGASEEMLGKLLGAVVPRRDVVVATKAGVGLRRGTRVMDTSRGFLLSSLDLSLERLGLDSVDLWQVHVWSDKAPIEETLSALDTAVSSGRAAYRSSVWRQVCQLLLASSTCKIKVPGATTSEVVVSPSAPVASWITGVFATL